MIAYVAALDLPSAIGSDFASEVSPSLDLAAFGRR
jgi:hypothetical protein